MTDGVKIYPWCENTAANLAHDAPEMILAAEQLKGFVLAMAAIHNKTGNYIGKIVIRGGRKDWHVVATDPAAMHIELGHRLSGNRGHGKADRTVGRRTEIRNGGQWVQGLHIMRNAAIAMRRVHA